VFVHNFRPGVMDKLNPGTEKARSLNPRLIYLAVSGFDPVRQSGVYGAKLW